MRSRIFFISNKVRTLFLIVFSGLMLTGCSVINKFKSRNKEKVETIEIKKKSVNAEVDSAYSTFSSKSKIDDVAILLSHINWSYDGADSAEIEISQTPTGIKIKTKGTATADLKVNSESQSNKIQKSTETVGQSQSEIHLKVNSESKTETKSKTISQEKEVKRFDLSAWWWIILLILAVTALGLYWFFGKPTNTGVPLPRSPLPPPPKKSNR